MRNIAPHLHARGVINDKQLPQINQAITSHQAGCALYQVLVDDPSERKLRALSAVLKKDRTHDNHQKMAGKIDKFLFGKKLTMWSYM